MDVACDGIWDVIFIELQGTSNNNAMILGVVIVIVAFIQANHAAIPILYVRMRVGIDGCEHILDKEGAPSLILDGIA